jgi:hypothetical protein
MVHASLINITSNPPQPHFIEIDTSTGATQGSPRAEYGLDLAL